MPLDLEPEFLKQPQVTQPQEMPMGSPEWIVDTWRKLYYAFPSPGLKERVAQAEKWATEQTGGPSAI